MDRERLLRLYLYAFGILNVIVLSFVVPIFFGYLMWEPRNIPTEMMISGIYFSMGIIMILIARRPMSHKGFVDFIILANVIHAIIMAVYAKNLLHLIVDAGGIGAMALIPLMIYPWGVRNFLRYQQ